MTYTAEEKCWIWLHMALKQRNAAMLRMVRALGSAQDVLRAAAHEPEKIRALPRVTDAMMADLRASADPLLANRYFAQLSQLDIAAVTLDSPQYPALLRQISAPPLVLYARGRLELLQKPQAIAVIGRRKPDRYGRDAAAMIARGLAQSGVTVVSGMAYGIDSCAHSAALDADGDSIAVLGCGVDIPYPAEKEYIYRLLCRRGLVISEYPPGTPPLRNHFPARNRIISGLCAGVVIVEAAIKSGTRITVDFALEQGRDVFAVPGNIFSEGSEGTNDLLQQGAIPVGGAGDILRYYGWQASAAAPAQTPAMAFSAQEALVLETLGDEELSFDELYERLDVTMAQLNSTLSNLELKGVLVALPGRRYAI